MNTNQDFAERLVALRLGRGLSKSGLARQVQVSTTCVWNWEEGNTFPRPEALARIAGVLGTTSAFLAHGENPPANNREQVSAELPQIRTQGTRPSVAEIVQTAREQIAAAAGLEPGQVKIILEYGS